MKYCKITEHEDMLSFPVTKLESTIRDYIVHLRHDRKLSPGTVSSYLAPIIHFYEMNGVVIAHASTRVQCIPDYSTISRRINKIDSKSMTDY